MQPWAQLHKTSPEQLIIPACIPPNLLQYFFMVGTPLCTSEHSFTTLSNPPPPHSKLISYPSTWCYENIPIEKPWELSQNIKP